MAMDTDGDVTFENQALIMNILRSFPELKVQMKLDEIVQFDFVADGGIVFLKERAISLVR